MPVCRCRVRHAQNARELSALRLRFAASAGSITVNAVIYIYMFVRNFPFTPAFTAIERICTKFKVHTGCFESS